MRKNIVSSELPYRFDCAQPQLIAQSMQERIENVVGTPPLQFSCCRNFYGQFRIGNGRIGENARKPHVLDQHFFRAQRSKDLDRPLTRLKDVVGHAIEKSKFTRSSGSSAWLTRRWTCRSRGQPLLVDLHESAVSWGHIWKFNFRDCLPRVKLNFQM